MASASTLSTKSIISTKILLTFALQALHILMVCAVILSITILHHSHHRVR